MSIRRRNDAVKSGRGIDGAKGENFTRQYNQNSWNVTPSGGNERSYSRNAKKAPGDRWSEPADVSQFGPGGVRRPDDFQYAGGSVADGSRRTSSRDIFDDVQANDGPRGGASAAIRYGVDKDQS
jgi:hypothetical protein